MNEWEKVEDETLNKCLIIKFVFFQILRMEGFRYSSKLS